MNQKLFDKMNDVLNCKKAKKEELKQILKQIYIEEKNIYEDNNGKCRMISLDTSSTISGWAYYEAGELISSGEINLSKEKDTEIRIEEMVMKIFNLLSENNPDIVVTETNVVGRNARTERMLGHIVGCVKGWTLTNYKEYATLPPSEWRKAVKYANGSSCPRGRKEAKEWAIQTVRKIFKKDVSDNEAEAILLGYALIKKRDRKDAALF